MDIKNLKVGDLVYVNGDEKNVAIFHYRFQTIKTKQVAIFLGCKKYQNKTSDNLNIFWTVDLYWDHKKVIMFLSDSDTKEIERYIETQANIANGI